MAPRASRAKKDGRSLGRLLASREIVVACGPGGVGKTTVAAAAAVVAAARLGGKVLVLTIDPARRLADALGLEELGNRERRVPNGAFSRAGVEPLGELYAAMLDTKESWDSLVSHHAPDARTRDEILANPLYRNMSSRFVQSHDYIAMERLFEIHAEGNYDLIVVDTPPTRNALDFLDAPERMAEFFSSRLLRWLVAPYRSRIMNAASKPFYQAADRILGTQFLSDIAEFFVLLRSMHEGFVERARSVQRLLADRRTSFIVVSTLEEVPLREGEFFAKALADRQLHLGAIVLNKVLPAYLRDPAGATVATRLRDSASGLAGHLSPRMRDVEVVQLQRVLTEVGRNYLDYAVVARREEEQRSAVAALSEALVSVPYFDTDVYDLEGLLRVGERLWG
jgi:anion-transporting  ArsA/GET3 family ATPase